jgi:imidazolonepropionase
LESGTGVIDVLLLHAGELVTCAGPGGTAEEELGVIEDGAMAVEGGRIAWVGDSKEARRKTFGRPRKTLHADGGLVTPGFIDPHTHLAFAGTREDELERKASGESYISILKSGGGILRTVRETREASVAELVRESTGRLAQLMMSGVTTAEVKTGYGQSVAGELKMLRAIGMLRTTSQVEVIPTFLGLHAAPSDIKESEYVDRVIKEMLPAATRSKIRPAFSDCFCEEGIFSRHECRRYLEASRKLGFALKIHADEFEDSGGASLAAEVGCVSADHLGKSAGDGIQEMGRKHVSAVLLPGTSLYSSIPYADARGIMKAGCPVALGTDLSPNSWIESPQIVMSLACAAMKLTPAQALLGFTKRAAAAIAREDLGRLTVGGPADFVVHSISSYRFLPYRVGGHYVRAVYKTGNPVYRTET